MFHGTLFLGETVSRGTIIFGQTSNMARKRWTPQTEITPSLIKFREKRKWQINLRRYVLEKSPCPFYAPYFGLDIALIRQWFEFQFIEDLSWGNFATAWQFDHIVPVTYFDSSNEEDLKLCWNFTNLRVEAFQKNKARGNRLDVLAAKAYFKELHEKTEYKICRKMIDKIEKIEISELASTEPQQKFIKVNREYLEMIENYSVFEFELLNSGRSIDEVNKERDFFKSGG